MGNGASSDKGRYRYGYHVLRVKEGSPADRIGLRPFFDYIMAVNGIRLNVEDKTLHEQLESFKEKPMLLDVYSTREQDVKPKSPAVQAGLQAHRDYIIGTPLGIMRGEDDLYDLVEDYIGEPMPLHVYNMDSNDVREVVIVPRDDWGGSGLLGCDVGYGYLHRLPTDSVRLKKSKTRQTGVTEKGTTTHNEQPVAEENHDTTPVSVASAKQLMEQGEGNTERTASSIHAVNESVSKNNADKVVEKEVECLVEQHASSADNGHTNDDSPLRAVGNLASQLHETTSKHQSSTNGTSIPPPQPSTATPLPPSPRTPDTKGGSQPAYSEAPLRSPQMYRPSPSSPSSRSSSPPLDIDEELQRTAETRIQALSAEIAASVDDSVAETPTAPITPSQQDSTPSVSSTFSASDSENDAGYNGHRREPPPAIAARMKPGLHGRGGRPGHDGFSSRGKISLEAAQSQAQQQSTEYRAQLERNAAEEKAEAETEVVEEKRATDPTLAKGSLEQDKKSKEEIRDIQGTQIVDPEAHEHMVEGMIRNMALGASVFTI
ncbi:Golgi reassembly-stacking protein 2 [Mortierella claussenii]|nr:Golgi reassembly-stacking protein 2 [Mortierella claussenii]